MSWQSCIVSVSFIWAVVGVIAIMAWVSMKSENNKDDKDKIGTD